MKIHRKGHGKKGKIRYAQFDDELKMELRAYKERGGKMPIYADGEKLVGIIRKGARHVGLDKLANAKRPVHALKHSFCTNWVSARRKEGLSEDLRGLSKQVGTEFSTPEVYLHIADEVLTQSYSETMKLWGNEG